MVIDRLLTINPSCHLVRECSLNLCYCFLILCRVNIFVAWYLFLEQYSTLSVLSVYLYILVILANWGVSLRIHVFWIFHWHRSNTPHSAGLLAGLWRSLFRFLTLVLFSALWTCLLSNDTMSTSNTSDLDVGNVPSIPTSSANVPNATSQERKICKPQTPVLDVVSVMNIIDCTAKFKNGFTTKLSKNVSDFSTITSNALSKCGQLTKNHLAENLLTWIKYCDVIPRPPFNNWTVSWSGASTCRTVWKAQGRNWIVPWDAYSRFG